MPWDPPPLQPSPAERYYMELRLRQDWEAAEAERQWWNSLSEQEREEIRQRQASEKVEAAKRAEEAARQAEIEEEAHRSRIKSHEDRHGGRDHLEQRRTRLQGQLDHTPRPDHISGSGTLLVMMFGALLVAGFAAPAVGGFIAGLVVFELVTVIAWALWMHNRRERRMAHEALQEQTQALPNRFGCGSATCAKCYFESRTRNGLAAAQARLGVDHGCGDAACRGCYPETKATPPHP
jgi:hypothetical protein